MSVDESPVKVRDIPLVSSTRTNLNNSWRNAFKRHRQQRSDPGRAAHLLGVANIPSPTQQSFVMAPVNHPLHGGGQLHEEESSSEDEDIDALSRTQTQPQIGMARGTSVPCRAGLPWSNILSTSSH